MATTTDGIELDHFNNVPETDLLEPLLACCASKAWVAAVLAGRPYAAREDLHASSDDAVASLGDVDLDDALAGHPRIGGRIEESHARWARDEQSGMAGADADVSERIRHGNVAYEERFGHVYLVCATGLGSGELLSILEQRLGNDPTTETRVVRDELAKINRLRLDRLLGDDVLEHDSTKGGTP